MGGGLYIKELYSQDRYQILTEHDAASTEVSDYSGSGSGPEWTAHDQPIQKINQQNISHTLITVNLDLPSDKAKLTE